jgi:hypothetical protein
MTADQITEIVNANKGELAELTLIAPSPEGPVISDTVTGQLISVNSKGVNFKVDGRVTSRALSRIAWVAIDEGDVELTEDDEADMLAEMIEEGTIEADDDDEAEVEALVTEMSEVDALVEELDGVTTAELAAVFGIEAKELRVTLRALGMGVGKGHRYHLTADQITTVKAALEGTPATA